MKLRPSVWNITWRYLIVAFIILAATFGMTFSVFFQYNQETGLMNVREFGFSQIFVLVLIPTVLIIFYVLSITSYYYVIEKKFFVMKRFWKEISFDYSNIEFIDIEESRRKKQVIFYGSKCKMRFLLGDKDGKLLETLINKCPNTLTVEEFRRKHPEERY